MKLPNGDRAIVEDQKLADYCLNPHHRRGGHKARVFEAVLGITRFHTPLVRQALLLAAATEEAVEGEVDAYGTRYVIDFQFVGPTGAAKVRSAWIIRTGEDTPRLATCYVL